MYNMNPSINLGNVYGNNKLKYSSSLLNSLFNSAISNIVQYKQQLNVQTLTINYQKYFDKTIFNQIRKIIPSKCDLKHGIVYGNNDFTQTYICPNNNNVDVDVAQISKQDTYILEIKMESDISNIYSNTLLHHTINSITNDISSNILNNVNIYNIYSTNTSPSQIIDTLITPKRYNTCNSVDIEDITKYITNYYKLVVTDQNLNNQPQIDIQ